MHRDHDAPFDDGDLLELGFEIAAPLHVSRRERALLRGKQDVARTTAAVSADRETLNVIMPAPGSGFRPSSQVFGGQRSLRYAGKYSYRSLRKIATVGRLSTSLMTFSIFHKPLCSRAASSAAFMWTASRLPGSDGPMSRPSFIT